LCAACAGPVANLPPLPKDAVEAERRLQQIAQIKDYYAQLHRVDTVAYRIRTANRADCKEWVSPQIGLFAATPQSLPAKYRKFSAEALDLRWVRATVISVVDGAPAAQAGIKFGDELISFNGEPVPVTGTSGWIGRFLKANGEKPVRIAFRRDDKENLEVTVGPVMGCAIPMNYVTADAVNAFTDGDKIVISSAIVTMARSDAQLAVVMGHELAHVNLGHISKQMQNTIVGAAGGVMVDVALLTGGIGTGGAFGKAFARAGSRAYSVGFEREADYVGAYYATRAGYDVAGSEEFWRAMGLTHPDSIRFAKTHPTTPERFIQMQKAAAEIADKQRRHLALAPELKTFQAQPDPPPPREGNF
jgi:Zn-dependent protease with chaperone function